MLFAAANAIPRSIPSALAVVSLSLLIWAPGALASEKPAGVVEHGQTAAPAEVRDYWTPERMRNAVPVDSPEVAAAVAAGEAPDFRAAPSDQETFPGADTLYPQRIHGKLVFRIQGVDAGCSATVVTSFSRDVILTAGHCLANPGPQLGQVTFSTNVAFVPGYRNGAAPFGIYPATNLQTPGVWAFEGDISQDVGAANLVSPSGIPIQDQLGSRGIGFNRTAGSYRGKVFQIFGYPAQPAEFYDGERLILCLSPFLGFERGTGGLAAGPCRQQEGSSGGGWVVGAGLVNSVVSHGGCAIPSTSCTTTVGTYLGDLAFNLWASAGGGLPKGLKKRVRQCIKKHRKFNKEQRCLSRVETFQAVIR